MQKFPHHLQNVDSPQHPVRHTGSRRTQKESGQQSSPTVFPEKRGKVKQQTQNEVSVADEDPEKLKPQEHKIDIADEHSDLLGYEIFSGKLALGKKSKSTSVGEQNGSGIVKPDPIDAKLTRKALIWGFHMLSLEDVISVSYNAGLRHFTVHSYPTVKRSCGLSCFLKPQRRQKDLRFLAASAEEAIHWVSGFADQQCFINCLPHPIVSNRKQASDILASDPLFDQPHIKCKALRRYLWY